MLYINSSAGFANQLTRQEHAASTRAVADAINRVLAADEFDATALAWLVDRKRFADAVRLLGEASRAWESPWVKYRTTRILLDRHNHRIRPFRLAVAFAVRSANAHIETTMDDLHRIAAGRNKCRAQGARCALAALGIIDWPSASRRERAAYVLNEVCRRHLERAS